MGIIKTAMMSGAAIYGVKQLARTAEMRGSNSNSNIDSGQGKAAIDPEYLEWVERKRRSAHSAPPEERSQARSFDEDYKERCSHEGLSQQKNLYLTQEPSPPSYDYSFERRQDISSGGRFEPIEFAPPRQQTGFVEDFGQSRSGRGADIGAFIGQGMSMLQSQGGKCGKGDFASKFLNK